MEKILKKLLPLYFDLLLQKLIKQLKPLLYSEKLLPLSDVLIRVGFGSSYVYDLIKEGNFPKPIKIGNSSRWRESEIQSWIAQRIQESANGKQVEAQ